MTTNGSTDGRAEGIEVTIEGLRIEFGDFAALKGANLAVKRGELFTLLGPSGCGKTTLLRSLAGFVKPSAGRILFDGRDVTEIQPWNRNIGFVFQNYALWPTKSIFKNVAYGLEMRGVDKQAIQKKVAVALDTVELSHATQLFPAQLSGGMQQRAALARAIIIDPPLLLFDEPLSNLDAKLRVKLRKEIRDLQTRLNLTAIYVTHDQEEALDISDRIAVMRQGEIDQIGSPQEIYDHPATAHVADFVGKASFVRGHADSETAFILEDGTVLNAPVRPQSTLSNAICAFVRPERVQIVSESDALVIAPVVGKSYLGHLSRYWVRLPDSQELLVESSERLKVGETVGIDLPELTLFDTMPIDDKQS